MSAASTWNTRLVQAVSARLRRSSMLRLALLPDEVNLVYRLVRGRPEIPRVMFDVGAHVGSTLRSFAADGWAVYAFEPDAHNRAELERIARAWPHVRVDARAVTDRVASEAAFYTSPTSTGVSALAPFEASHTQSGSVSTTTLDAACTEYGIGGIGVLKVDVEGFDLHVLRGIPWQRLSPHVVVCEFEDAKTQALNYGFHDLARYLVDHGYNVLVSEWYPVVRYGRPHRWRRLVRYPCELVDPRCFGNLLGFLDDGHARAALRMARPFEPNWRTLSALRRAAALRSEP